MAPRSRRTGAPLVLALGLGLVAPAFLPFLGSPAPPRSQTLPGPLSYSPLMEAPEELTEQAPPMMIGVVARTLAVLAAVLIAAAAPRASYAGLLSEFGSTGVEYNDAVKFGPKKQATLAQSRAEVLESAAAQAQAKALEAERQAQQRKKAAELFGGLDTQRKSEEAEKQKEALKREEQQEQVLKQMEKQVENVPKSQDENVPKAQLFFRKFFAQKQEERQAEVVKDRKKDEARELVKATLLKRQTEAQKAAEEAEAIAKRIEELAKEARRAADAARKAAE